MTKTQERRFQALFLKLSTMLIVTGASLALGVTLLERSGVDVEHRLWKLRERILGPESIGIFEASERYGWDLIPMAEGRARRLPDYDVTYRVDRFGHRVTPGAPGEGAHRVVFLGGSYTFGGGVEDDEAYPAVLQAGWANVRVVNAAVNAWGTVQSLLRLEDVLAREESLSLVVYGFIDHHRTRNYLRKSWLQFLDGVDGRRSPYFDRQDGALIFRGLADPDRDAIPDSAELAVVENDMTAMLVRKMAALCAERGIPFAVIHLPDGSGEPGALAMLRRSAGRDAVIDLRPSFDFESFHFAHDIHPTPESHRQMANLLRPLLESFLWPPRPYPAVPEVVFRTGDPVDPARNSLTPKEWTLWRGRHFLAEEHF